MSVSREATKSRERDRPGGCNSEYALSIASCTRVADRIFNFGSGLTVDDWIRDSGRIYFELFGSAKRGVPPIVIDARVARSFSFSLCLYPHLTSSSSFSFPLLLLPPFPLLFLILPPLLPSTLLYFYQMGCVQSSAVDEEAKARKCLPSFPDSPSCCLRLFSSATLILGNEEIENQLRRDKVMAKNEIKMLLLGAGESGKVRHFNASRLHRSLSNENLPPSPLFSNR